MRSLFWLLAVFAAAVALVILGRVDAGYVLFIFPPYRVELTMLFLAIVAVASFLVLYAVLRLLGQAVALPTMVRATAPGAGASGRTARWPPRSRPTTRDA